MSLQHPDRFSRRHNGPSAADQAAMLKALGLDHIDTLIDQTVPAAIRMARPLNLPPALSEFQLLNKARQYAAMNEVRRTFIGMGYAGTITPPVILRNVFENPNWYTQYTPYQAEIAQGRLEALLNYQTMITDLTGLDIANASLLDEGTAAAEAMMMLARIQPKRTRFFISDRCHPQTIAVVQARATPFGLDVIVGDVSSFSYDAQTLGVLVQYPATDGEIVSGKDVAEAVHAAGGYLVAACDLLALTLIEAPGSWGADVAVGNTQRFGVPMGFGGPHAAFFATRDAFKRQIPGRLIGVTIDRDGNPALRMALQTREQHIRRDKATSNICTAQVLLSVMAGMYGVYHGPSGLRAIATYVHRLTQALAKVLEAGGNTIHSTHVFDTLRVTSSADVAAGCDRLGVNLRPYADGTWGVSLDETTTVDDLSLLAQVFGASAAEAASRVQDAVAAVESANYAGPLARTTPYLTAEVFNRYHSESELMRYMHRLTQRDLSLTTSMIPLGSCTMKLNAAAELMPVSMPGFSGIHPFVPTAQVPGYHAMMEELRVWLAEITGFAAVSLQPNSGASGEYAGLMVIRGYHESRGESHRNVCLIPTSAHGTNPASAVMAGMQVVPIKNTETGDVDLEDLREKAAKYADRLGALMVTYPSTFGVFEEHIRDVCDVIHQHGGQVYMDGANMNAQVGLCRPGDIGADVCHLNLHKTFAIPHGGGGPGMGPIGVAAHLAPFLPGHPVVANAGGSEAIGPISAAPYGSASILLISWAYIAMMGPEGLTDATRFAILNANYLAHRLQDAYGIVYRGAQGRVAHEFILDLRPFKPTAGISEVDVAKRLMDYNYHAPTMSWPVLGTMMIEPTESESLAELDRFADAMLSIRDEIRQLELGLIDREDNPLRNAPHTPAMVTGSDWTHPYSREQAAFPLPYLREGKFWPSVRRVDDAYGDRNLVCTCAPMEAYAEG